MKLKMMNFNSINMKTKSKIINRIKKLSKERNNFIEIKQIAILEGRKMTARYAEEDIRHIEGKIEGIQWVLNKKK